MQKRRSLIFSSAALVFIATAPLLAQDRDGIEGFRNFSFGTPFGQIQDSMDPNYNKENEDGSQTFKVSGKVAVSGISYAQYLKFKENELIEIRLVDYQTEVSRSHCDFLYSDVTDKIQAVYGGWNMPPQTKDFLTMHTESNRRNFPDTSAVRVYQFFISAKTGSKCSVQIIYISPPNDGTF